MLGIRIFIGNSWKRRIGTFSTLPMLDRLLAMVNHLGYWYRKQNGHECLKLFRKSVCRTLDLGSRKRVDEYEYRQSHPSCVRTSAWGFGWLGNRGRAQSGLGRHLPAFPE